MHAVRPPKLPYHTDDALWCLLRDDGGSHYLYVECEQGSVGYDRLIKLNDHEYREYHGLGWLAIQYLANRINYFTDEYRDRHITGQLYEVAEAIAHGRD